MKNEVIERICIDCRRKFLIYPNAQDFFKSRGLELPKRCRACREKKKQERKAEEAARQFEKELSDSPYVIKEVSDIDVSSPATTLYVIGNGFDLAHGVPSSYSKFRDWLGRRSALRETLETYTNRLKQLEDITNSFKGVDKSFAIQAGREVRIMVVPEQISDDDMVLLARDISKKIEESLEDPGQIKVNVIRESRVTDYAK